MASQMKEQLDKDYRFEGGKRIMNILAPRNHDSGNMETGIPERKPPLIGLITIHRKLSECQAQSRFAGRKPALHWRDFLYPT